MDNRRYQELRTYCITDLGENMNRPGYENVMRLWVKLHGEFGRIEREEQLARHLFQCRDLTTRERAAAYLLAVITNHRMATWQREASPPNGQEPMPPLDKVQADELERVTSDAVRRYVVFLSEPERAVLLADCEAAPVVPANDPPVKPKAETAEQRQARRYQMCIDAGLTIKDNTYASLPRGIGDLARAEGISTAAFSKDVKLHIECLSRG